MTSTDARNSCTVQPRVINGLELYVTDVECGMSQIMLAEVCGVKAGSIRSLLKAIECEGTSSKRLNKFFAHSLYLPIRGRHKAKLVRSQVCEAVCQYYAFESRAKKATALTSYRKFDKMGMDAWIRDITGHPRKPAPSARESAVQKMVHGVLYSV